MNIFTCMTWALCGHKEYRILLIQRACGILQINQVPLHVHRSFCDRDFLLIRLFPLKQTREKIFKQNMYTLFQASWDCFDFNETHLGTVIISLHMR